jgi:hypothetical protein
MSGRNLRCDQFLPIRLRIWSSTAAVGQQSSFSALAF